MPQAAFSDDSRYILDSDASPTNVVDAANNRSQVYYRTLVIKSSGSGIWSFGEPPTALDANISGSSVGSARNFEFDFRPGGNGYQVKFIEGNAWVQHDADGNARYYYYSQMNLAGAGAASVNTGYRDLPRIPKRPASPGQPTFSEALPTSVRVSWTASPNGNGAPVSAYVLRRWDNEAGTGAYTDIVVYGLTQSVTGLTPGQKYRFVVYAYNSAYDNGGYSLASAGSVIQMLAGVRIRVGGVYKLAIPYVKVDGKWKLASPYVKKGTVWKLTS